MRCLAEQIASSYEPPARGRHADLSDPDRVQTFLAAIADGNYRETACKIAGISKQTFYNWIKAAETGNQGAIAFVDALEKAEALAEAEAVRNVRSAGKLPQFWAAEMTYLERRHPDRWGRRQDSANGPAIVVNVASLNASDVKIGIQTGSTAPDQHTLTAGVMSPNQVESAQPIDAIVLTGNESS